MRQGQASADDAGGKYRGVQCRCGGVLV